MTLKQFQSPVTLKQFYICYLERDSPYNGTMQSPCDLGTVQNPYELERVPDPNDLRTVQDPYKLGTVSDFCYLGIQSDNQSEGVIKHEG